MDKQTNKHPIEKRSFNANFTAEEGHTIVGRPVVYDAVTRLSDWWGDEYDEVIDRGALDKTDLRDVRFLVNHDYNKIPIARSRNNNGNSSMMLNVDSEGLEVKALLDIEKNADAAALYSAVKRGDISGMSFGFSVAGESWEKLDEDIPLRHITEIRCLIEVSAVTFPAYQQTEISVRDSRPKPEGKGVDIDNKAQNPLESGSKIPEGKPDDELFLELLKVEAIYG